MKVGFIGLGDMGGSIARRLGAAGNDLTVSDLRRAAADSLVADGAEWGDSPMDVMARSDVVFVCVRGAGALAAIALGEKGVVHAASPDKVFVSLSTVARATTIDIAGRLAESGIAMLDAPVSGGGPVGAVEGTLGIYVGGDVETLERVRPLLETFAASIIHVGDMGAGSVAKIVHNMVEQISRAGIAEGMTLAAKAGVRPSVMLEVLKSGSFGRQRVLHSYIPSTVFAGDFDSRGGLDESLDVAELAMDLAQEQHVPVALGSLMTQEKREAVNRGWGARTAISTFLLQEERAGVELRETKNDLTGSADDK